MITNEKVFLQKALNSYDNPQCISVDEFKSDLERFSQVKRILQKYKDGSGPMHERLVLNHLVICFNLFGQTALDLAFFKVQQELWSQLLTYLFYLNRVPDDFKINGVIDVTDISLDANIVQKLREL